MEYRKTIEIEGAELDQIEKYLTAEPTSRDECLDEDDTIIYTAVFDDGIEMDVKCCGVQYNEYDEEELEYGNTNTAWCEAVLFDNGSEVANEMGEDVFEGEWPIEYEGNTYIAEIVRA